MRGAIIVLRAEDENEGLPIERRAKTVAVFEDDLNEIEKELERPKTDIRDMGSKIMQKVEQKRGEAKKPELKGLAKYRAARNEATMEYREKIKELHEQGKSCQEIADILGKRYDATWSQMKKMGLKANPTPRKPRAKKAPDDNGKTGGNGKARKVVVASTSIIAEKMNFLKEFLGKHTVDELLEIEEITGLGEYGATLLGVAADLKRGKREKVA